MLSYLYKSYLWFVSAVSCLLYFMVFLCLYCLCYWPLGCGLSSLLHKNGIELK